MAAAQQWIPCTVLEVNTDASTASFLFVFTQQIIGRHKEVNVKLITNEIVAFLVDWHLSHLCLHPCTVITPVQFTVSSLLSFVSFN